MKLKINYQQFRPKIAKYALTGVTNYQPTVKNLRETIFSSNKQSLNLKQQSKKQEICDTLFCGKSNTLHVLTKKPYGLYSINNLKNESLFNLPRSTNFLTSVSWLDLDGFVPFQFDEYKSQLLLKEDELFVYFPFHHALTELKFSENNSYVYSMPKMSQASLNTWLFSKQRPNLPQMKQISSKLSAFYEENNSFLDILFHSSKDEMVVKRFDLIHLQMKSLISLGRNDTLFLVCFDPTETKQLLIQATVTQKEINFHLLDRKIHLKSTLRPQKVLDVQNSDKFVDFKSNCFQIEPDDATEQETYNLLSLLNHEDEDAEEPLKVFETSEDSLNVLTANNFFSLDFNGGNLQIHEDHEHQFVSAVDLGDGEVALLDEDFKIIVKQMNTNRLQEELELWKKMVGFESFQKRRNLKLNLTSSEKDGESLKTTAPKLDAAKHGKEDPLNEPHVGGSSWAGGTGGSNTAGLGGRGGPYRLDKGHKVTQISEALKNEVTEELQKQARELNRREFKKRLVEIKMNEEDFTRYQQIKTEVKKEIKLLSEILTNVDLKSKERSWLKNQTFGELDENKIVDSVVGENNIFKRRGVQDTDFSFHQNQKAKLIFLVDCSGSMYRFNSQDGRLDRQASLLVMLMEALEGHSDKFEFSIIGHSGESSKILFSEFGNEPQNKKERYEIIEKMYLHAQFCMSGDHTVEATERARTFLEKSLKESESGFLFLLSDANLRRYGISPKYLANVMKTEDKSVSLEVFAIFLATFGVEADRLKQNLPPGKGFTCMNTSELPSLMKKILVERVITE